MKKPIYWSDIKLFMSCQRCFYIKQRFNIKPPIADAESFALPNAMDKLRKEDADFCRISNTTLSIMKKNNIKLTPFDNEEKLVDLWRKPFYEGGGINYHDSSTGLFLSGSIDDIFIDQEGKLSVIEFKSAVENTNQSIIGNKWYKLNELQVSYYAWLLNSNNYDVSPICYLIYSIAYDKSLGVYPVSCMFFKTSIFQCTTDYAQIENILNEIVSCLELSQPPEFQTNWNGTIKCQSCKYYNMLNHKEKIWTMSY